MPLPERSLAERTAERLRRALDESAAGEGDRLPAERKLAERFGVSRSTLRLALARLSDDGLVAPSSTRGWYVSGRAPGSATPGVRGFADLARARDLPASSRVLASAVRGSTIHESERLRMAPGAAVFTMTRLRYLDSLVVVLEHNRVPLALCPQLVDIDFTKTSLFDTLRASDPPQIPSLASYEVEARLGTMEERELLEIDGSTPVLTADQVASNQYGQPIEYTNAVYRADRYRFRGSISH